MKRWWPKVQCVPQKKGTLPHERAASSLWMCILCKLTCGFWNGWGAFSPKIQPSESTPSDANRPALERHTYEEGHTNAEKHSKYRSTKKAKNRGSFPSFNFGCMWCWRVMGIWRLFLMLMLCVIFKYPFCLLIWLFVSSFFCQVLTTSESSALSNTNPEGNVEDESKWRGIISPASNFELQLHYPSMMHDAT